MPSGLEIGEIVGKLDPRPLPLRALRVRQGTDLLQDQGTESQSWNDIPTCREEGVDVQYLMCVPCSCRQDDAGAAGVLRRPVPEGDANRRIQGLHGKAGTEADLPHRERHASGLSVARATEIKIFLFRNCNDTDFKIIMTPTRRER
jgi:hypothetical protein